MGSERGRSGTTLASCPIRVEGDWHAPDEAASAVIARVREVALAGVDLHAPEQPSLLVVENRASGPPSMWLHAQPADAAWIVVDVAERAWCQLAYQFGHECGHAAANSWRQNAAPHPPSQWLEESLAESFSLRALGLLAKSWAFDPVFPGDQGYADAVRAYRRDILREYNRLAREQGAINLAAWFASDASELRKENGLGKLEQAAVTVILRLIEPEPVLVEDYNGMNRWPERTTLPVRDYLRKWRESCQEIGAPGRLPVVLGELLGI